MDGTPGGIKVGIVGPCGSGKSTLAAALQRRGVDAHQIAQEHSFVPDMWRISGKPAYAIFLDASHKVCGERKNFEWTTEEYDEQQRRLKHARENCDLYLHTDSLSPQQVLETALEALAGFG